MANIHIDLNLLVLLVIALMNAYTAWLSHRTKANITLLEKNTNSIKDALVVSTAIASRAEGLAAGRLENIAPPAPPAPPAP